jgi:type IV pilus assembly protein PilQ
MDKRMPGLLSIIVLTMFFFGCAETQKPVKKPDIFSQWQTKADESQGHSPPPRAKQPEVPKTVKSPPKEEVAVKPEKRLPTQKVSLRMHNADIVVVLRALARSVGQNILINDKVKGMVNVDVEAIPWDQAFLGILRLQGLSYAWEGDILRVMAVEDMENELKIMETRLKNSTIRDKEKALALEARQIEPLLVTVVPVDYANAGKLQEQLKEYLSKDEKGVARGSILVDEHTNSLVFNAIRDDIDKLVPLVRRLDKPTPQILIQSNIIQTTKDTAFRLGIQWGGFYNASGSAAGGGAHVTPGGTGGTLTPILDAFGNPTGQFTNSYTPLTGLSDFSSILTNPTGIGGQGYAVNLPVDVMTQGGSALGLMFGRVGGNILDMQLSALERDGKLNILSSPSITTLDNQMAFTENGEKIPYVSTSGLAGTQVQFQDAVLRLEITPHVISDDVLKMKIVVKNDQVDPTRTVLGNPYIIKKQTDTTLICRDGETIVISGLTKITTQDIDKGVPGLKDAPLFKWFFSSVDDTKKMEDVLIFITPHILKQWYNNDSGKS